MHKPIYILLVFVALANLVYQFWPRTGGELIPVKNSQGMSGYVDAGGRVRIDFDWDEVGQFDEDGLAWVLDGSRYGLINRKGKKFLSIVHLMMMFTEWRESP